MSIFTKVLMPKVRKSKFDLSHDVKTTFDMGEIIPTCVMDTLPGDKWFISVESMIRFNPLIAPIMHRVKVKHDFFFVPNRILWDQWEKWITGELEVLPPTINNLADVKAGTVGDYLGYPEGQTNNQQLTASALPIAAYAKIYDDWYRDENLQDEITQPLVAGQNSWALVIAREKPKLRAWMHDYFTSALPFAQKGASVSVPLLERDVQLKGVGNIGPGNTVKDPSTGNTRTADPVVVAGTGELHVGGQGQSVIDPNGAWQVPAETTPMENLRRAWSIQVWLEKNARAGTRYIEFLIGHFNQSNGDARLHRSELIGSTTHNMIISEVVATAQDNTAQTGNPIGELAGHGIAIGRGKKFKYKTKDFGWIIGMTTVTPFTAYTNNLPKMLNRQSYLDYAFPDFQNIGEQEILNSEVYIGNETISKLGETFGYIPRFAEYKYHNNTVHGNFKQNGTLEHWHLGRTFANAPGLNAAFIQCDPDKRIFAVQDDLTDNIYAHIYNSIDVVRPLVKYAVPGHFGNGM